MTLIQDGIVKKIAEMVNEGFPVHRIGESRIEAPKTSGAALMVSASIKHTKEKPLTWRQRMKTNPDT
jgi:hypothetical protein